MIIQDELITRINHFIEVERTKQDLSDLFFKVKKSKTTNSIYITVYCFVEEEKISSSFRISDHYKSRVDTKVIRKATNFHYIERKILSLIEHTRKIRFEKNMQLVAEQNKEKK